MPFKTLFLALFFIFFSSAVLVDCAHKKAKHSDNPDLFDAGQATDLMNTLTEKEVEGGWILLFDGNSLKGWHGFRSENVPEGWTVENGQLTTLGRGSDLEGDIITEEVFDNFELYLEWKVAEGGNSGLFFRVLEDEYPTVYATGPEYQLIDDLGYPEKLEDWQTCGANYGMHPPLEARIKPAGEWNSLRLIVNGDQVVHYLNGNKVVEYTLWNEDWENKVETGKWSEYPMYGRAVSGHIGLQDHGDRIWFRNIKIRKL